MTEIQLVWFKRNLRVRDHRPLYEAAQRGAVLPLYVVEPAVMCGSDYDRRHWAFTHDCLLELRADLARLGAPLVIRQGDMLTVLERMHDDYPFNTIWTHEETGNDITYQRDRAVLRWAKTRGITVDETPNNGVIRVLKDRDERIKLWKKRVEQPLVPTPQQLQPVEGIDPGHVPTSQELHLTDEGMVEIQPGGENMAHAYLHSFLYQRGHTYHAEMSSPVTADTSCSRISPYLAYGSISLRQIFHKLNRRRGEIYAMPPEEYKHLPGSWKKALSAFESRLHWHDHFIQKLEDEPRIEFESFIPQFDTLRDDPLKDDHAAQRWEAYITGKTGYPMVDACIRSLRATGWVNFRMRAMLVSFASYDLWVKWQMTGEFLARLFTDYEAGIHYSQTQMQSGTTGINTLRIYNPIKQGKDHDAQGVFVRQWVPELQNVPLEHLHEPWKMPPMTQLETRCKIGEVYPAPIVDHAQAVKSARAQIAALRKQPDVKEAAQKVLEKHGSRKRR